MKENSTNTPEQLDASQDNVEILEKNHGGTLGKLKDLPDEYNDLKVWADKMKYGSDRILVIIKKSRIVLKLYTQKTEISISAVAPNKNKPNGYLGGIASSRTPRVGETWCRGNDLADGDYSKETWNKIMYDIIGWELEPLEISI